MIKILIVIKHLDHALGGAEKILCQLSNYLIEKKCDVTIASFDGLEPKPFYPVSTKIKLIGLESKRANKKTSVLSFGKRIFLLRKYIKDAKPDLVISFLNSSMAVSTLACLGLGIPLIGSEHTTIDRYRNKLIELLLLKSSMFLSVKTTVISENIKQSYKSLSDKLVVISNPVQFSPYRIYPERKDSKIILTAGRLASVKNHDGLIRAMAIVKHKHPDWLLKIYGGGEKLSELEALVGELDLTDSVKLMGAVDNIYDYYVESDFTVFPSHYEGFGLVLAEALSAGLPSIAFKGVEGVDGLIIDGLNGTLVNSLTTDHKALAEAICDLIENKSIRIKYSYKSCDTIEENHPERIFKKWHDLILGSIKR